MTQLFPLLITFFCGSTIFFSVCTLILLKANEKLERKYNVALGNNKFLLRECTKLVQQINERKHEIKCLRGE